MEDKELEMKEEYDFSKMKARKNPYAEKMKRQITMNLNYEVIDYFKKEAEATGIPYQTLINLYLIDCVNKKKKLNLLWE